MVCAEDAISIYRSLTAHGIPAWIGGGWGIDALLRKQTRPHKDLDIIVRLDDVVPMRELLSSLGYHLKELWSENSWVVDPRGVETPTAFVLQDADGREVDAHAMRLDDQGNGTPAWTNDEGLIFQSEDLAGEGLIAGCSVRCLSPRMQLRFHTGYDLPKVQFQDLELLHELLSIGLIGDSH
ncbi:MAG: nucleotidyltransferase family protein [bacterium]